MDNIYAIAGADEISSQKKRRCHTLVTGEKFKMVNKQLLLITYLYFANILNLLRSKESFVLNICAVSCSIPYETGL